MNVCEFIKDGDTDEVKTRIIVGLPGLSCCQRFSASLYGFSQTVSEACAGEQHSFGFQPDGL